MPDVGRMEWPRRGTTVSGAIGARATLRMHKEVVVLGTSRRSHSGISAVVNTFSRDGLCERWRVRYLTTHKDGSGLRKALTFTAAWLVFVSLLLTGRVALVHVLAASRASFWRKLLFIVPASALRVRYIFHLHCGHFPDFYRERSRRAQRLVRWTLEHAALVLALSPEWKDYLAGIAPKCRVAVLPNPVALPPQQCRQESDRPTVLFLGVLKRAKGVDDLLHAWREVLREVPAARLILAGSGDIASARRLAASLMIDASIETPGWLQGESKIKALRECWAFTLPSHAEALPMSILEGMAAGIPIVATRVGGIPYAIGDAAGILFAPGDRGALASGLIACLVDESLRQSMGQAGRQRAASEFAADCVSQQLEEIWQTLAPACARAEPANPPWTPPSLRAGALRTIFRVIHDG
jgi:glycosyltransferase involved in cell wall biosynthesis